jgi:hypothetical protein
MGTKAMKLAVASFAALALAGCGPGFEKIASAPRPEPARMALAPETGPRSPVAKFAVSPGVPDGAGMRRIVVTGRAPGNEIEVTPAQLRAEILAIDRMLEKEGRAR